MSQISDFLVNVLSNKFEGEEKFTDFQIDVQQCPSCYIISFLTLFDNHKICLNQETYISLSLASYFDGQFCNWLNTFYGGRGRGKLNDFKIVLQYPP